MKYLAPPAKDDASILNGLATDPNKHLRRYLGHVSLILAGYVAYETVRGNAGATGAPTELPLPAALKTLLQGYFDRKEGELEWIKEIKRSSKDVCPMCGSLGSSTADHIFPQSIFAEFSFFSRNLVPACHECNSKRGNDYLGSVPTKRIIHPYYDTWAANRLVAVKFEQVNGSYQSPKIKLEVVVPYGDPNYSTVEFHLETTVYRTDIDRFLSDFWTKQIRTPERYFILPVGPVTAGNVRAAVGVTLENRDAHFGTPNNWESMVYAGMLNNSGVLTYLHARIEAIRADPTQAQAF